MDVLSSAIEWFTDSANWSGDFGIPKRLLEHIGISVLATATAFSVAFPVGLYIGHSRRFEFLAVSVANMGRALPSFGVLALVFPFTLELGSDLGGFAFLPTLISLILLGIPPILTNTYVGIRGVDPDSVEAARGMGLHEIEILRSLEAPISASLIVAGLRTSAVSIVATATLGAVFGWGGLGRFIVDGFAILDNAQVIGGAVLVALLAIATEVTLGVVERLVRPRHLRTVPRAVERASEVLGPAA